MTRALRALSLACLLTALYAGTPGCLRSEHGIVLELTASALPEGAASEVSVSDGTTFIVDSGELTVIDVALLRCVAAETSLEDVLRALPGPSMASAHEHDGSSLTIAGPFQISLVDEAVTLGAFQPSPGTYCALHVRIDADEDMGAPWAVSARAHTPTEELRAASTLPSAAHLLFPEPLVLDRPGTQTLHMSLFEAHPFAGMTSLVQGDEALGEALIRGVTMQGAVAVEPTAP